MVNTPIRLIARDLYRLQKKLEALENALRSAPHAKREAIEEDLRKCRAERNRMRQILEGSKQDPPARRPR